MSSSISIKRKPCLVKGFYKTRSHPSYLCLVHETKEQVGSGLFEQVQSHTQVLQGAAACQTKYFGISVMLHYLKSILS